MGEGLLAPAVSDTSAGRHLEGVPLEEIATEVGTPCYVYSAAAVRTQYERLTESLRGVDARVHFSAKANSSRAILTLLRSLGAGIDVVSGGELFRARKAGFGGSDIIFGGVGKTPRELREALEAGVLLVNAESEGELRLLDAIAGEMGVTAPVAIRVNPEVTVETHPYIRTGEKGNKFGVPLDEAPSVARTAISLPNVDLRGLDMHIGSQIAALEPYRAGVAKLLDLAATLRAEGADTLRYLDVGGGLAVTYGEEPAADPIAFAEAVAPLVAERGFSLILEPGRFLVGNAGVLVTRVLYRKRSGGLDYVITDAGMTDLLRPALYHAYHSIAPLTAGSGEETVMEIAGPVCESTDFLARSRPLPPLEPGDLLEIGSAGAYGFVMASNYNSRPKAAEVMVDGDRWAVVTERESYDDLVRHELSDPEWRSR